MATPAHVPQDAVFEFNIYGDERLRDDLHDTLATLHRDAPDIFWTNENTGHWVVTRYDLLEEVLREHDRFSASGNHPPQVTESMPMIPLNLDPPEHTFYRSLLMRHFSPAAVRRLVPRAQYWAKTLVDRVVDRGECEFMEDVASVFPVSIFMEMMGLPLEHLREYRALVVEYFSDITPARYMELQAEITRRMTEVLKARKLKPRDDMASLLQTDEVDGRRLTWSELGALTNLLFQAGMDTVANFAGFFFRYLAERPELQAYIRANLDRLPDVIEEGFRLFGVVNNFRLVMQDTELNGIAMRKGDMVACMLPLAGLDETKNPDPFAFKVDRDQRQHMLFSRGAHLCIGHTLAKMELIALLEEWFSRVPEFRLAEGYKPVFRAGSVMGLARLPLEWQAA